MRKKILVVEDDPHSRFMMSEMLTDLGFDVVFAENGEAGVEVACKIGTELGMILMDIHLPGSSGHDAMLAIRAHENDPPKNLPIFAVSADGQWHDPERVKPLGFDGAVPKPVRISNLKTVCAHIA